ncbi:surface lipoprotein assembly modifier, partial [Asticcacaulis biprosthecium]|uniref:surface lipoprotein assembly modifier n=1 Tax=Asticcacaulis biprosthecium TaxID=76891 RepID=UPI00058D273E
MTCIKKRAWAPCLFLAVLAGPAFAAESPSPLSAEISAGIGYDSNVAIDEIDQVSRVGDTTAELDAEVEYSKPLGARTTAKFSYHLSQTLYQQYDAFNLQTHIATADLRHDFGSWDGSLTYRHIEARVDGDSFLTMNQISPSASRRFGKSFMVRGSYTYSDKSFRGRPTRDGRNDAVAVDGYVFLKGSDSYVSGGLKVAHEDAADDVFSYDSQSLKLRGVRKLTLGRTRLETQLSWAFEDRSYVGALPAIGEPRHDRRSVLSANVEMPVGRRGYFAVELESGNYDSNLPSADYSQGVATARLGW